MKLTEELVNSKKACCQENKEHIRNYRRQYRKNNREWINEYLKSYYAKNKEQINQILRNQRQRTIGARNQESEKLETRLVPSGTFCGKTDGQNLKKVKTVINFPFGFYVVIIQ